MDVFSKAEVKYPYGATGPAKKQAPAAVKAPAKKTASPKKAEKAESAPAKKGPAKKGPAKKGTNWEFFSILDRTRPFSVTQF